MARSRRFEERRRAEQQSADDGTAAHDATRLIVPGHGADPIQRSAGEARRAVDHAGRRPGGRRQKAGGRPDDCPDSAGRSSRSRVALGSDRRRGPVSARHPGCPVALEPASQRARATGNRRHRRQRAEAILRRSHHEALCLSVPTLSRRPSCDPFSTSCRWRSSSSAASVSSTRTRRRLVSSTGSAPSITSSSW